MRERRGWWEERGGGGGRERWGGETDRQTDRQRQRELVCTLSFLLALLFPRKVCLNIDWTRGESGTSAEGTTASRFLKEDVMLRGLLASLKAEK